MGSEDNGLSSLGAQVMPRGVDWEKSRGGGWGGMTGWRRRSPRACCNLCSASGLGCVGGWRGTAENRCVGPWRDAGWEKAQKVFKYTQHLHGVRCSSEEANTVENLVGKRGIEGAGVRWWKKLRGRDKKSLESGEYKLWHARLLMTHDDELARTQGN